MSTQATRSRRFSKEQVDVTARGGTLDGMSWGCFRRRSTGLLDTNTLEHTDLRYGLQAGTRTVAPPHRLFAANLN